MQIGQLNKRIMLQKPVQVSDSMGGFTTTWTNYLNAWAAIWPWQAKEGEENKALLMNVFHRIRIRYRPNILPSYRVLYDGRCFDIDSILDKEEKHEFLDLLCKEQR